MAAHRMNVMSRRTASPLLKVPPVGITSAGARFFDSHFDAKSTKQMRRTTSASTIYNTRRRQSSRSTTSSRGANGPLFRRYPHTPTARRHNGARQQLHLSGRSTACVVRSYACPTHRARRIAMASDTSIELPPKQTDREAPEPRPPQHVGKVILDLQRGRRTIIAMLLFSACLTTLIYLISIRPIFGKMDFLHPNSLLSQPAYERRVASMDARAHVARTQQHSPTSSAPVLSCSAQGGWQQAGNR